MLEKTLESLLDCKHIQPVNSKGNQSWVFIGRTDAEAESPILWPTDVKSQFIGKDPDARKDWGRRRRGQQGLRWLDGIIDSMDRILSELQEIVKGREAWCAAVHWFTKSWTRLSDWTITKTLRLTHCLYNHQFSSVQSLSHVQLFVTPLTAACQVSLSITNSQRLLKLVSIVLVMPGNHRIFCLPLLLSPSIFSSIRVFSNESVLHIRWAKYWSFSFSISPSNEYSGLISFRMHWLDLLAVQGTLKSLLQHHSQKHQFFSIQLSL